MIDEPTKETIDRTVAVVNNRGVHHNDLFDLVVMDEDDIPMLKSTRSVIPNFKVDTNGLGTMPNITEAFGKIGEVFSDGTIKHGFQFNEPLNLYGKTIMCQTVDGMGTKDKLGGLVSFSKVFEDHIQAQCV